MGGHGHELHINYNMNAMKETDEEMLGKIQFIELVKFNPMHFHMECFNAFNMYTILGGAPSMVTGGLGAMFSYSYFASQSRIHNEYARILRTTGRLVFGFIVGVAIGYQRFGDRQRLHNAYVAERLVRRHPEAMELHEHDLYRCKDVKAPHEYYKWL
jgi:hypothetical protein